MIVDKSLGNGDTTEHRTINLELFAGNCFQIEGKLCEQQERTANGHLMPYSFAKLLKK